MNRLWYLWCKYKILLSNYIIEVKSVYKKTKQKYKSDFNNQ